MDACDVLEELREHFISERDGDVESLIDNLAEISPFELGRYQGKCHAYDELFGYIRQKLKHGDL